MALTGAEVKRRWRERHPGRNAELVRQYHETHPGREAEQRYAKLEGLAGRPRPLACEHCGSDNGGRPMEFDHDHACCGYIGPRYTCGKCFRGWLCRSCNRRDVLSTDKKEKAP
jgi:hypothetical protein